MFVSLSLSLSVRVVYVCVCVRLCCRVCVFGLCVVVVVFPRCPSFVAPSFLLFSFLATLCRAQVLL